MRVIICTDDWDMIAEIRMPPNSSQSLNVSVNDSMGNYANHNIPLPYRPYPPGGGYNSQPPIYSPQLYYF